MNRLATAAFFMMTCTLSVFAESSYEEIFTRFYDYKLWGVNALGEPSSGGGATLKATQTYRKFLSDFFELYDVKSVVDLGCADWEYSQAIDWTGIDYKGYDVVEQFIEKDKERYETDNIHFYKADVLETDLPKADVLLCKDVLQHFTNEDITKLIKQFSKYKYCLITNDVQHQTLSSQNPDCERGHYRPIDLTKPPFSLKGVKILTYYTESNIKQVLLINNEKDR